MTGRVIAIYDLSGEGVSTLLARMPAG
jgi:hypothetical protein